MVFFNIIFSKFLNKSRSSYQRCSIKKAALKIFAIFTGKHRPFQERHAIARARAHTRAKAFRCMINHTLIWSFCLQVFTMLLPVLDQDMALLNVLKITFFSSVFFRLSLMLKMYETIVVFAKFVWFAQLLSKYKNSFLLFFSRFALLILGLRVLFLEILQYSLLLRYSNQHTAVVDYENNVTLSILILEAIDSKRVFFLVRFTRI